MQTLTKDISDIIITEAQLVNEKLKGLNFLETLKLRLVEKIETLINLHKFPLDQSIQFEIQSDINVRRLTISLNYYKDSISISKKKIDQDSLFILFNEVANIDIYKENNNNAQSLLLYKNTGISLPVNTRINAKLNKNTIFIEIQNIDFEEVLKK